MRYIAARLLLALPTLLLVSLIVFLAIRMAPGDPAEAIAGIDASQEIIDEIRRSLGLDRPLPEQYARFLWGLLQLNLGNSIVSRLPVTTELASRVPPSLVLALSASLLAAGLGIALGVLAATRQRSALDYALVAGATVGLAVPGYVLGLLLILVFSVHLRLLPATGAAGPLHYVLPALTLALAGTTAITRQARAAVLETLRHDYVRTARAKGLVERLVIGRHVLRNALIPVVTIVGSQFGQLLGGLVIIEIVFSVPGIGGLIVERILARDYPVVQGGVLLLTLSMVIINLVVDLTYAALDPRIRYS